MHKVLIYGTHLHMAQSMMDYDFILANPRRIAGFFGDQSKSNKLFFGDQEILLPTFTSWDQVQGQGIKYMINMASARSAIKACYDAINNTDISHIVLLAEGIPERDINEFQLFCKNFDRHISVIGPSSVGGIVAGSYRNGYAGGNIENIHKSRLYRPGSIGLITKSGGMFNEMTRVLSRVTNGLYAGWSIGGDRYPCTSMLDIALARESIDDIKIIVMLGEVGNTQEIALAEAIEQGRITKPVVAWCTGTSAESMVHPIQFGHAGAKANHTHESASYKNAYLARVGATVPKDFASFGESIAQIAEQYGCGYTDIIDQDHDDIYNRIQKIQSRRHTSISSSISDERGNELTYNKIPVTDFVNKGSLAYTIGHLRLQVDLPDTMCDILTTMFILLADHGPAVSGAHNTIVASRAGKDLVSSVISGLATIGPRFGGAISGAAREFFDAVSLGKTPDQFVVDMHQAKKHIPGIGHKIKSIYNPDTRCSALLSKRQTLISHVYTDFALAVATITSQKKPNLILNIDGLIGAILLDMLTDLGYTNQKISAFIDADGCNAIFVLARSIGLIGHHLDQSRLGEGLYRGDWDDIFYL